MNEKIKMPEGFCFLVMVQNGEVTKFTADFRLPHAEFIRRQVGTLPEGAWVGSVVKFEGEVSAVNSFTYYGNQLPGPVEAQEAVKKKFC